jgi:lantibiotic biosynthesis protein
MHVGHLCVSSHGRREDLRSQLPDHARLHVRYQLRNLQDVPDAVWHLPDELRNVSDAVWNLPYLSDEMRRRNVRGLHAYLHAVQPAHLRRRLPNGTLLGVTGPIRDAAIQAALHVATRLRDPGDAETAAAAATAQSEFPEFSQWFPPGIAQGNAGLGVLWAYLDCCFPEEGWDAVGKAHLEVAARAAETANWLPAGMFSGLSGLAFAAWQLSRGGQRYRRLLASLDDVIARETIAIAVRVRESNGLSVSDFDAISGLSGIGAYLLCRHEEPAAGVALANTVEALISLATRETSTPAWHTPPEMLWDDAARKTYPHGNLNCGLAHGSPGMLALLALVRLKGLSFERLDEAIVTLSDWLCANRLDDDWGVNWPTAVQLEEGMRPGNPDTAPGGPGRTAWCYGSPGVARALWLAGRALDLSDYCDMATAAMEAVFRRPIPTRMIDSPTFCHGVAGLLEITLRFANETRLPGFADESQKLVEQVLRSFQPDSRLGFRNIEFNNNQTDQPGLLDGAAGVAIVLLAAATGIEPTWDRLFLLS